MGYSSKSPWLIHYDGSSCNGCDIEVLDSLTPRYDIERFGIINTGNPKHADIFLVTGSVNHQNINVVKHIYDQMLEPKVVVACGACACTGGVFRECYNVLGGVDKAIPVDVYAPGCAVPGGGTALIRVSKVLDSIKPADDDELAGVNIIRNAIEAPLRQIAHNAGFEGSIVVEKVRQGKDGFGFNAATGEYEDLIKAGVIDPKKVTRTALLNAASVASLLLTTECAISEKPEPKKDAPAKLNLKIRS